MSLQYDQVIKKIVRRGKTAGRRKGFLLDLGFPFPEAAVGHLEMLIKSQNYFRNFLLKWGTASYKETQ